MSLEAFLKTRAAEQAAREEQWEKDFIVPTSVMELSNDDLLYTLLVWEKKIASPPDGVLLENPAKEKRTTWVRQAREYRTKLFEEALQRMKQ